LGVAIIAPLHKDPARLEFRRTFACLPVLQISGSIGKNPKKHETHINNIIIFKAGQLFCDFF
jgi:hypothetical protein